jgi:hypothetical protein
LGDTARNQSDDLFLNLAEQVKLPFVQILHAAELLQDPKRFELSHQEITVASRAALHLIEGYILSIELQRKGHLDLEPVSISSVMHDTAQTLSQFAKLHNCEVELHIQGRYGPVMANRRIIQTALVSLGHSFIEAAANRDTRSIIQLAVRRQTNGISAGIFSDNQGLSSQVLKQAKILQAISRQPLHDFTSSSGAGVFIADSLFTSLETVLKVARMRGLQGLTATFAPSRQLQLV